MHHTLFCDVGWDNGDLLRPCSGSPWRTTMPGHPQVMQRRNDTQRSNLFFCREIHHISKFQIESNRFISYHIIFMYVFGWMEGWCSSLLHPQSKLVKTTKGESSAQSESCEDQWFQCMDIYIYILHIHVYIPRMIIDDPYLHQCSHGTINLLPVAMQNMTMPVSSSHGRLNMEYP